MNTQQNFILNFGKYKGQYFSSTPQSYQSWLLSQEWFTLPSPEERMPQISKGWDGYSRKGQTQEWAVFQWEKRQASKEDCRRGICNCCEGSSYYGV
jgi:hypothetical protein